MGKAVKRFVTRLALAVLIVLAAYAGWRGGDAVFPRLETALGIGEVEEPDRPELVTRRPRTSRGRRSRPSGSRRTHWSSGSSRSRCRLSCGTP